MGLALRLVDDLGQRPMPAQALLLGEGEPVPHRLVEEREAPVDGAEQARAQQRFSLVLGEWDAEGPQPLRPLVGGDLVPEQRRDLQRLHGPGSEGLHPGPKGRRQARR